MATADAGRTLGSVRFWCVLGVLTALGGCSMLTDRDALAQAGVRYTWALAVTRACGVFVLSPLAVPFVAAGGLALDRASRFTVLKLTRGMARVDIIASYVLSSMLSSAIAVLVPVAVFATIAWCTFGHGDPGKVEAIVPFLPQLLRQEPIAYLLLVAAISWLCSSAACVLGVAMGSATRVPLVADLTPAVLTLALGVSAPRALQWLNPLERADFISTWADWNTPVSQLAYWSVALLLFTLVAMSVYRTREE